MRTFHILFIAQLVWVFYRDTVLIGWGWFVIIYSLDIVTYSFFKGLGEKLGRELT